MSRSLDLRDRRAFSSESDCRKECGAKKDNETREPRRKLHCHLRCDRTSAQQTLCALCIPMKAYSKPNRRNDKHLIDELVYSNSKGLSELDSELMVSLY